MKQLLLILNTSLFVLAVGPQLMAQAFQGFEDRATDVDCTSTACYYTDTDQSAHELLDFTNANGRFIPVNDIDLVDPTGTDRLGFRTFFTPTGSGTGLSDGDLFGFVKGDAIINSFGGTGAFEGSQIFFLEDVDGEVRLEFTPVRIAPSAPGFFSMRYIYDSTFDTGTPPDRLNISLLVTGCAAAGTVTLVDATNGAEPPGSTQVWQVLREELSAYGGCDMQLVIRADVNSFSEEIGFDAIDFDAGAVLPVEFMAFAGRQEKNEVVLEWSTALETDNRGFRIERSMDGANFAEIGWVNGRGNTSTESTYTFKDASVVPGNTYYYRLRQEDFDGAFAYSDVVHIQLKGGTTHNTIAQFFPNPTHSGQSRIELLAAQDSDWTVTIFDPAGRVVNERKHRLAAGNNQVAIDLASAKDGAYLVRITGPEETIVRRVIR